MVRPVLALSLCASCAMGPDSDTTDAGNTPPPTDEAQAWIDTQNAVRAAAQPPPATPLPPLSWSADAARVAQSWADNCVYQHNQNRGQRGENIAANKPPATQTLQNIVSLWAGEVSDYGYATNTCTAGKECGHYTQIVWKSTSRVGCAHRVCNQNSPWGSGSWEFWVCDYEPPGNWLGQKPY